MIPDSSMSSERGFPQREFLAVFVKLAKIGTAARGPDAGVFAIIAEVGWLCEAKAL